MPASAATRVAQMSLTFTPIQNEREGGGRSSVDGLPRQQQLFRQARNMMAKYLAYKPSF